MRRTAVVSLLLIALGAAALRGQVVIVADPANIARNAVTAALKEYLVNTQNEQRRQLRRMAQRLSALTSLDKFALPDAPRWRTHDFESPSLQQFTRDYVAGLNYGDQGGSAYRAASQPLLAIPTNVGQLTPLAARVLRAHLANIDVADAVATAATNDTGRLRYNGRRELAAIDALEAHVTDGSSEQSATAVLDKISGAELIAGRQRQARGELLVGVLEQLLIEDKTTRDAEVEAINMQLTTWRDGRTANAAFVAGSGEALRSWRQP
jgi:hypothetical protein